MAEIPLAAAKVTAVIQDHQVESCAFRARMCLGIAAIGLVMLLAGLLMSIF
ncbi:hypothetical protein [Bradyrhizobium sp. McL0616]|uniref:hypothetical protein n=1 Tax=Bradyrhizobium sp. McL0616 TaxID=3415674 RepID=UPI003CEFE32D